MMSFAVIALADGLSEDETDVATRAGPIHVGATPVYPELMTAAGFDHVQLTDVSDEYVATCAAWVREWDARSAQLKRLVGTDDFLTRQSNRRRAIVAATDGLLQRYLISGVRP
jgi:hypothetical protein